MPSRYVTGSAVTACSFLDTILSMGYVVYESYLDRWMYVSVAQGPNNVDGRLVCGFWYALSPDLIHWTEQRLLVDAQLPWCPANPQTPGLLEPVNVLYPSIVDHTDTTIKFERAGRTPYLYCNQGVYDRDVMGVPLTFTRLD